MNQKWTIWMTGVLLCVANGEVRAMSGSPAGDSAESPSILMIVTGHETFPDSGEKTGLWLAEFAEPWWMFIEAGCEVLIAVPDGGEVPVDPRSMTDAALPEHPGAAITALQSAVPLREVDLSEFDAVFFPGGHGTMFDFPNNPAVQQVVETFANSGRPLALVCHGPAALVGATAADGSPMVRGRRLAAFSNDEEAAVELTDQVPFLLEDRLEELGATVENTSNFVGHVVVDGSLITGQNPASSERAAVELLELLQPGE